SAGGSGGQGISLCTRERGRGEDRRTGARGARFDRRRAAVADVQDDVHRAGASREQFLLRCRHFRLRENAFALRENSFAVRENRFPLRENPFHEGKTSAPCGKASHAASAERVHTVFYLTTPPLRTARHFIEPVAIAPRRLPYGRLRMPLT